MKLTKPEEQIMKQLWETGSCYMKDFVEGFEEPKPAYTTVATIVGRMVDKGYIGFKKRGSVREYYPEIQKSNYFSGEIKHMVKQFFNNSHSQFASFFTRKSDLSIEELKELRNVIDEKIQAKQK